MLVTSDSILLTTSPFTKAHILRVHSFNECYFSTFYKVDSLLDTGDVTMEKLYKVPGLITDVTPAHWVRGVGRDWENIPGRQNIAVTTAGQRTEEPRSCRGRERVEEKAKEVGGVRSRGVLKTVLRALGFTPRPVGSCQRILS